VTLPDLWFALIAVLWTGYFVLEGFDFGVGMGMWLIARDEADRRVMLGAIGPLWDGNEVWLLTAGGATFAAFPEWYATLFSGFYLPLLLILAALIVRGVAFEYRGKRDSARWRHRWDLAIGLGSALPSLLWGVAFGDILRGVPLNAEHEYVGGFWTLLDPYALLTGLVTLSLFLLHGMVFTALKTAGGIRDRANACAAMIGPPAIVLTVVFLAWTEYSYGTAASAVLAVLAGLSLIAVVPANRAGREGLAFLFNFLTIGLITICLFVSLHPNVLPSDPNPANSLTVRNAAAGHYTLTVMTIVALCVTPLVLIYQGWTYWVFRQRLTVRDLETDTAGAGH
jgi:cytochrome bd ubiquinol oxidase subunit II